MMPTVSLSKRELGIALARLAAHDDTPARLLYSKLAGSWDGLRADRTFCTANLYAHEFDTFRHYLPSMPVRPLPVYVATYIDPDNPKVEVTTATTDRPTAKRTFKIAGGKTRLTRKTYRKLTHTEQENIMARKTANLKNTADDELDGLEDLDELDDTEDEAPAPKASKAKASRGKAKAAPVEDDEDDDDLDLDDDEDDEEDEAPAPKAKAKAKTATKAKRQAPPTRALPDGRFGPNEIAEAVGCTGRDVRMFLRKHNVAKNEDLGRYAFTAAQRDKLVKKMKASRS